jgi:hypothetical protein
LSKTFFSNSRAFLCRTKINEEDQDQDFAVLSVEELSKYSEEELQKDIAVLEEQMGKMKPNMNAIKEYRKVCLLVALSLQATFSMKILLLQFGTDVVGCRKRKNTTSVLRKWRKQRKSATLFEKNTKDFARRGTASFRLPEIVFVVESFAIRLFSPFLVSYCSFLVDSMNSWLVSLKLP